MQCDRNAISYLSSAFNNCGSKTMTPYLLACFRSCIILLCKLSEFKIVFTELFGFACFFVCLFFFNLFLGDFWCFLFCFVCFIFWFKKWIWKDISLPQAAILINTDWSILISCSYMSWLYCFYFLWTALAKIQTNYRHLKYEYCILVTFEMLLSFWNFMEIFPRQAEQISLMSFCIRNSRQLWK